MYQIKKLHDHADCIMEIMILPSLFFYSARCVSVFLLLGLVFVLYFGFLSLFQSYVIFLVLVVYDNFIPKLLLFSLVLLLMYSSLLCITVILLYW